jgi:ornithine lipid ester-linked acyl 2-hydroxylase
LKRTGVTGGPCVAKPVDGGAARGDSLGLMELFQAFRRLAAGVNRWVARRSLVGDGELISRERFPFVETLEAHWPDIRRELDQVLFDLDRLPAVNDLEPSQRYIARAPVWKVYLFQAYGERSEPNCRRCPITAALIEAIPNLEAAFFSILEPGAHLKAHYGAYSGLVRIHLGVKVPEPSAAVRIKVGRETIHWREGACVIFDDTYLHEAWNETDSPRVVLLLDVLRPFPPLLGKINRAIVKEVVRRTTFVRNSMREHRAWEKAFYADEPAT